MDTGTPSYKYISLEFCPTCDTSLSMMEREGQLCLFCRSCSYTEKSDNIIVHQTRYDHKVDDIDYKINSYSRFDNTLPISTTQKCPQCKHNEAKFLRQSDSKTSLMFFCIAPGCDAMWR
ncbi:g7871 [Coccomyxa viridis]|uniref:G7871 protein n=1 Tax=Coccomyxa viridis TaxID=1274662 RepID=A0ABP1FZ18_9CHLO